MTRSKWLIVIVLCVIVMAGLLLYGDIKGVQDEFASFAWWIMVPSLGLAFGNYVVRFVKWQFLLRVLGHRVVVRDSALVFFSGLAMAITPGKVGEVLKAYLLKETSGVAMKDTVPVVVAERLTDLLSLVILSAFGVAGFAYGLDVILAALAMCSVVIVLAFWTKGFVRLVDMLCVFGFVRNRRSDILGLQAAMVQLVGPWPLLVSTFLSVVAWGLECFAFYLILHGIGVASSLQQAVFIYSLGTIAGAVSMLPGGLLVTEAGMVGMLVELMAIATRPQAVTSVFLVRVCTLWFAVLAGAVALAFVKRRLGVGDTAALVDEAGRNREMLRRKP